MERLVSYYRASGEPDSQPQLRRKLNIVYIQLKDFWTIPSIVSHEKKVCGIHLKFYPI